MFELSLRNSILLFGARETDSDFLLYIYPDLKLGILLEDSSMICEICIIMLSSTPARLYKLGRCFLLPGGCE